MSRPRIFIDGHAGTTGLRIREWLASRDDLAIWTLDEHERKSEAARRKALAEADLTVLCLPDEAAVEAASWAAECDARLIDASSAHRVAEGWVYGLPELAPSQRDAIRNARFVSNPGCYPTAFVTLVRPLVDAGLLRADAALSIHALSGYTGGGKSLIERWEDPQAGRVGLPYEAPYALERVHKHVPEMHRYSGLAEAPFFVPAVGPFACGMRVEVAIPRALLAPGATGEAVWQALADRYRGEPFVEVAAFRGLEPVDDFLLDPTALNGTNRLRLHALPNAAGHVLLVGLLDNLGKGASGAAIQSLNLMLGLDETTGLPR
ncbi:MAG: N-acetyl-gamma-glutamyl-phosphate reductase [Spirochaetaceae bacterium]|nr:N-acetyl-gamma-glutamyl-phosphate reductase [Myxococcales bacterium]MCB9726462.1 N-acetyl-gamma-glutamyl-phosphate reductase [Spirochaetaceae bacterium]HPG28831.1 N-acetyl-gamma-glutamyl-phosphate reductase [Myxococcota bacterium]